MKKFMIIAVVLCAALSSCGYGNCEAEVSNVDSVAVDSVDSVQVDTVSVDSLA